MYPNPTCDQVTIDYQFQAPRAQTFVHLRDLFGRELGIHALNGNEGQLVLNTKALAPGMYVVEIRVTGCLAHVQKLMVE